MFEIRNICCIGAGYVGGPTMSVIADNCPEISVNVVDVDEKRINAWNSDNLENLPIFEPGLKEIIQRCRGKNLYFSTEVNKHIAIADIIFISVNTPTKKRGIGAGMASDLKWVESCARQVAEFSKGQTIIVEKSTIPVKTAETIQIILNSSCQKTKDLHQKKLFSVLSNPEFLAEGSAINDLKNPDRVLIGGDDEDAINTLSKIYSRWIPKNKIITTNVWSSELAKLTANAFLAQRISSINSVSALCEATGANISEVAQAIGLDKRIGEKFLKAGPGFGGSCFKKDLLNLIYLSNFYGLEEVAEYWQKVVDINAWQQKRIIQIIVEKLFGTLSNKKLAILGFAFKANTNDTRESPAIQICKDILEEGGDINIYDPKVKEESIYLELGDNLKDLNIDRGSWNIFESIEKASQDVDAIVICTEWEEFRDINWEKISKVTKKPAWIFDTRFISNHEDARASGLNVWQLGVSNF